MAFLLHQLGVSGHARCSRVPAGHQGFGRQAKPKKPAKKTTSDKSRTPEQRDAPARVDREPALEPAISRAPPSSRMHDYLQEALRASARTLKNSGPDAGRAATMVRLPSPLQDDSSTEASSSTPGSSQGTSQPPDNGASSAGADQELARQIDELFGGSAPASVVNKIKSVARNGDAKPARPTTLDENMAGRQAERFADDVLQSLQQLAGSVATPAQQQVAVQRPDVVEPIVVPPARSASPPAAFTSSVQAAQVVDDEQMAELQPAATQSSNTDDQVDASTMDSLIQAALAGFQAEPQTTTAPSTTTPHIPPAASVSQSSYDFGSVSSAEMAGPASSLDDGLQPVTESAAVTGSVELGVQDESAGGMLEDATVLSEAAGQTHQQQQQQTDTPAVPVAGQQGVASEQQLQELAVVTAQLAASEAALQLAASQTMSLQSQLSSLQSQLSAASTARDALQQEVSSVLQEKQELLEVLLDEREQHKQAVLELEARLSQGVQQQGSEAAAAASQQSPPFMSHTQVEAAAVANRLMSKLLTNGALSTQDKLSMSADVSQILQLLLATPSDA